MELRYPIGVETFSKIREEGCVYVDKTEIIYKLTQFGQYVFLSRPRRFGKSLMLSTMEAYFEGRKELFDGLWLGQADGVDWTPRPVLRLNFVDAECNEFGLRSVLENQLSQWEAMYGVTSSNLNFGQRFSNIIAKAHETSERKVVVLIDEYDKVLVNSLHDEELHETLKQILKPVFGVLKGADRHLQFVCLTGVSRFSKLSIFSDLNNIIDISLDKRFCTVCGITESEINRYLSEGVHTFADAINVDYDEMMQILKANYDGYHFSENCPDIYNPFSLINALDAKKILHRWFESGTPSFLVKMLQSSDKDIRTILNTEADSTSLSSSDTMHSNLIAVMFQTGYLTIKDYNAEDEEYTLGLPNREVAQGFFKCLLPYYSGQDSDTGLAAVRAIRNAVRAGDVQEMMEHLKTFLGAIPYSLSKGRAESYFQNNLYIIFTLLGFSVQAEYTTARGRIDILLQTPKFIYVMELKLDGTPEDAIRQIEQNGYCEPFANDSRRLFRIGMNFSQRKRNIDRWIIE